MKHNNEIAYDQCGTALDSTKPVIFWDTCALLDLLTIPCKGRSKSIHDFNTYKEICEAIEAGDVLSVSSSLVSEEYDHNLNERLGEITKHLQDIKSETKLTSEFMSDRVVADAIRDTIDKLNPIDELQGVLERICVNTTLIKLNNELSKLAENRLRAYKAPAENKGEYKDCYIWVTFMAMASRLDSNIPKIFFTSNVRDYQKRDTKEIPQAIKDDCSIVGGDIVYTIGELFGELRAKGVL